MFENFKISSVTLNVVNLQKMTYFYQNIVGLSLLESSDSRTLLGIKDDENALIELTLTNETRLDREEAGLYHTAFLLPSRSDLANCLIHLSQTGYTIDGAADHGYSEALYLTDPEGNGIEIYADKPVNKWDILPDGQISGVTEPLDVTDLLTQATTAHPLLPSGSFIGHVHLSVINLGETEHFLTKNLTLDVVYRFGPHAVFLSRDRYHHQIAINTWSRARHARKNDQPGLNKLVIHVSQATFSAIQKNSPYALSSKSGENSLLFSDPNGFTYEIISL